MATNPAYIPVTVEDFFALQFPPDKKFELVNGIIVAMAGGTRRHAAVQGNIFAGLFNRLRGSGCRPYGSDMGIRTGEFTIRYPDVSILCGESRDADADKFSSDPVVIVEVLSPSTADNDERVKLAEYRSLASVATIIFVDPADERLRVVQRTGPMGWRDDVLPADADVEPPSLNVVLPRAEIFARD